MENKNLLQADVKRLFEYKDGDLYWAVKSSDKIHIGDIAGSLNKGRKYTKINLKTYQISRLIFLYHHGFLPRIVDHIDNNPLNNKIENLRAATISENNYNSKIPKNNSSGVKNVRFDKVRKKWKVELRSNKKYKFIGNFLDLELAELVAIEAREKYHMEFARNE
jgi:hypothetical protein